MVARNMTNLTPIQLEEFESVFRHFDRDSSNTLQELEFSAALASLGLVYDEDEMHQVYVEVCGPNRLAQNSGVSFEQFIRFMVSVTEDQNTAEQVFQSFREVADGKVCFLRPVYRLLYSDIYCSPMSPSSTSAIPLSPTKSLNTWSRPCPSMKARTCWKTAIWPSSITSASWRR